MLSHYPWPSRLSHSHLPFLLPLSIPNHSTSSQTFMFKTLTFNPPKCPRARASLGENESSSSSGVAENLVVSELLDAELMNQVSAAKDAEEALQVIAERSERNGGVVGTSEGQRIISAALDRNNPELALSVFYAMRASFDQGVAQTGSLVERWKWSRPDVRVYTSIVQGLAASLRVSDALRIINIICQVGVSPAEEVPFGKVVRCPSCVLAIGVAQPQQGIQIVSCSKCRYQYELVSGNIVSIASEEIRISSCRTQHGCSSMEKGAKIPAN